MAKSSSSSSTKLHIVMYPWFAFGHMFPYLNVSNKLAQRGHSVTYVLPKGAQSKLEPHNRHPNLIRFFPLVLPHVDGLPIGAETASDVPVFVEQNHLITAYDLCKDQLQDVLTSLSPKPDFVFTDFGCWVPAMARQMSIKTVHFSVLCASILTYAIPVEKGMAPEDEIMLPSYPSSGVNEASPLKEYEIQLYKRFSTSLGESDAIAIRTCQEVEGRFCDHLAHHFLKPILQTGPILDDPSATTQQEDKWLQWLNKFEPSSVVFCAFGSQIRLEKDQYQELLLGFESCRRPFLVALVPPLGCSTVEEAFPEGFEERTRGKGWAYGGWVPQTGILNHPSVGCFVSHCGFGSMWEGLVNDCQIVLVPFLPDQVMNSMLLSEELKVGVQVERSGKNGWISKESLRDAIESVMVETRESACTIKINHANLKNILSPKSFQERYTDIFVQNLQDLKD